MVIRQTYRARTKFTFPAACLTALLFPDTGWPLKEWYLRQDPGTQPRIQ
jgi:hypothetical protein